MTVTPSERHSGLCIRLMRYRRNDPGMRAFPEFAPYCGYNTPSLYHGEILSDDESVIIELPEYDMRRDFTGKDSLCALQAFWVQVKTLLPLLYGYRMCPDCPHCVDTDSPCMDIYGSNATPMGGSGGRCDGMIGAVESQKGEGALHVHMFLFFQMLHQFSTLHEIADRLREGVLGIDAWKRYVSIMRRATYPDLKKFEDDRESIESAWPAFAQDRQLSRPPAWIHASVEHSTWDASHFLRGEFQQEGRDWKRKYNDRLQHVMSHMNHHIHPLDPKSGKRRPLRSCCKKDLHSK